MALSMKQLDSRISALENSVDERLKVLEEAGAAAQVETPEYVQELLVAVINSLYNQRSAGAYNMAKKLEEKYFDGKNLREIGDEFIKTGDLYSATKN